MGRVTLRVKTNTGTKRVVLDKEDSVNSLLELIAKNFQILGEVRLALALDIAGERRLNTENGDLTLSALGLEHGTEVFVLGRFEIVNIDRTMVNERQEVVGAGEHLKLVVPPDMPGNSTASGQESQTKKVGPNARAAAPAAVAAEAAVAVAATVTATAAATAAAAVTAEAAALLPNRAPALVQPVAPAFEEDSVRPARATEHMTLMTNHRFTEQEKGELLRLEAKLRAGEASDWTMERQLQELRDKLLALRMMKEDQLREKAPFMTPLEDVRGHLDRVRRVAREPGGVAGLAAQLQPHVHPESHTQRASERVAATLPAARRQANLGLDDSVYTSFQECARDSKSGPKGAASQPKGLVAKPGMLYRAVERHHPAEYQPSFTSGAPRPAAKAPAPAPVGPIQSTTMRSVSAGVTKPAVPQPTAQQSQQAITQSNPLPVWLARQQDIASTLAQAHTPASRLHVAPHPSAEKPFASGSDGKQAATPPRQAQSQPQEAQAQAQTQPEVEQRRRLLRRHLHNGVALPAPVQVELNRSTEDDLVAAAVAQSLREIDASASLARPLYGNGNGGGRLVDPPGAMGAGRRQVIPEYDEADELLARALQLEEDQAAAAQGNIHSLAQRRTQPTLGAAGADRRQVIPEYDEDDELLARALQESLNALI